MRPGATLSLVKAMRCSRFLFSRLPQKFGRIATSEAKPVARAGQFRGASRIKVRIDKDTPDTWGIPCVHCKRKSGTWRARGLCQRCYKYHRHLYPRTKKRKPSDDGYGHSAPTKPASKPTSALPGSLEKIEVMRSRAAAGEELYHPLDAPNGDGNTNNF